MKKIPVILLALVLLYSCKKENVNIISLGVDIQASFNQDYVHVTIDNKDIINEQLKTNNLLGVCDNGRINTKLREGQHVIKIVINSTITKTEAFSLSKARYIGVNYSEQTKAISLVCSDQPFVYD